MGIPFLRGGYAMNARLPWIQCNRCLTLKPGAVRVVSSSNIGVSDDEECEVRIAVSVGGVDIDAERLRKLHLG
jgi:hypothetical protein